MRMAAGDPWGLGRAPGLSWVLPRWLPLSEVQQGMSKTAEQMPGLQRFHKCRIHAMLS